MEKSDIDKRTMKMITPLKLKSGTLENANKLELRRVALWVHHISANTCMRSGRKTLHTEGRLCQVLEAGKDAGTGRC